MAYQIAVQAPDQIIGVLPLAGSGVQGCLDGSPGLSVPVYMIVGQLEPTQTKAPSTLAFEDHRRRGGLWAFALEAGAGHAWPVNNDVMFNWAAAVTAARLPATVTTGAPVQLRSVSESSGWLADRTSPAIGAFACFTADKSKASWIPTEQNARELQLMTTPGLPPALMPC